MALRSMRAFLLPATAGLVVVLPMAAAPTVDPVRPAPVRAFAGIPRPAYQPSALLVEPDLARTAPPPARPVVAAARPAAAPRLAARPAAPAAAPRPALRSPRRVDRFAPGWQQRNGEAALRLISYRWRELGWGISFHPARRGILGIAYEPDRHIYIFVRRDQSIPELAFTIAHEIGHAYDFDLGTGESRHRWRALRGIDRDVPWTGCEGCADLATPAGDFAEVFALWQVGPVDFRSRMAPMPDAEALRTLRREFRLPDEVYAS
ncbi:MAG TPA: hypothetical protein VNA12_02335 [Mycobacteriales bacterium]|nr:hypothetical protein [Mycobacteriales bacterium]